MTRITAYKFDEYSALNIKEYLEKEGYNTEFAYIEKKQLNSLLILGTKVSIDLPEKGENNFIIPSIRFEDYPKDENFESDKKLYEKLCRKFRAPKTNGKVNIQEVKDWDKIEPIIKENESFLGKLKSKFST